MTRLFALPEGVPLGYVASISRGVTPEYEDDGEYLVLGQGVVQSSNLDWRRARRGRLANAAAVEASLLTDGDVVINSLGSGTLGRVGSYSASDPSAVADGQISILRSGSMLHPRYLYFTLTQAGAYEYLNEVVARGSTNQTSLSTDDLGSLRIALPPLTEQTRIARFLDDQATRIDQIINARLQQIVLGDEEIKSYRAELMADVERGATVLPLNRLSVTGVVQIGRGHVISKEDLIETPGDYPVYSSARDNDGAIGSYGEFMFDEELVTWSVDGGGHVFYRAPHRFSVTNICAYCRVLRTDLLDTQYLSVAMQDQHSKFNFDWQDKAHPGVVRNLYVIPQPSLTTQRTLVGQLSERADDVRRGVSALSASIALLQEFKGSLIAAAVSGEFDVSAASGRGIPA